MRLPSLKYLLVGLMAMVPIGCEPRPIDEPIEEPVITEEDRTIEEDPTIEEERTLEEDREFEQPLDPAFDQETPETPQPTQPEQN